ncbi:phenoloxidase-activating factor 2-like [Ostrinia furnacalis]|uniref:phenoloxidase-activating factor 2-like n=1 Tax=Ostrinia furnacalis TaxID=93504 RepID=UPI00103BB76D|nr:phenoloxidase-activating factor 2-like [Ostrinia furnacalis]
MCLWLLTACISFLPTSPSSTNIVVIQGVPAPIVVPTAASTMAPTVASTMSSTSTPATTMASSPATTMASSAASTMSSSPATSAPTTTPTQVPNNSTAVKFPRDKRSADLTGFFKSTDSKHAGHTIKKRESCKCVSTGTCIRPGTGIDIRIVTPDTNVSQCPAGQEYCCTDPTTQLTCGTLQTVPEVNATASAGQANYGEFPWQALVLTKQNNYLAGGVLIDRFNVLTVTHRLVKYVILDNAPDVKVRLGEWDAEGSYEPIPFKEFNVSKVFTHPLYNESSLQFDITVLRLESPVPLPPAKDSVSTINTACLPPTMNSSYVGQRCMVAGWGKNMFGVQGMYQQILKKVDVPIVASATCQTQLRTARLGANFVLDTTSFICAGDQANKDSCTGDGGSGLVCQVNGQWVVVGLVAWGLGCASANVPGVYANVAGLLPWIQQQIDAA